MADMIVNLLDLPYYNIETEANKLEIRILRALAPDKHIITEWVKNNSTLAAASECDVCFSSTPVSCFIAMKGKDIIGYACYNAIAPDFFGPTAVVKDFQKKGIGKLLLIRSLQALRDEGYIYAIIGGVGPADFYEKCVGAKLIENSTPGIYKDFIGNM